MYHQGANATTLFGIGLVLVVAPVTANAFNDCGVLEQQGECLMFRSDGGSLYQLMPPPSDHQPGERVRVLGNEDSSVPVTCPAGDGWITNASLSQCYPLCGTLTTTADFNTGQFINLNPTGDRLQVNTWAQTEVSDPPVLPYIWVACSGRHTVVRIATETHFSPVHGREVQVGDILGEYRTAPDNCGDSLSRTDPSRTTVDFDGNVWVANRHNINHHTLQACGEEGDCGHLVKIGTGLAFQWVDRNCNGVLDTSTGLGDILPWRNTNGVCTPMDVNFAEDELILLYQPIPATGTRTVAVDRQNNLWVGGSENRLHGLLDGQTGRLVDHDGEPGPDFPFEFYGCGGYGGVVDCRGVLWSARGDGSVNNLLRLDPTNPSEPNCPGVPNSYGLGVDTTGNIWNSRYANNHVTKVPPDGVGPFPNFATGGDSRGVAVTPEDNHVWIANSGDHNVTRLDNDGNLQDTITVGLVPTGVAVDSRGKVWVANNGSDDATRIDPDATPPSVDFTVDLDDVDGEQHPLGHANPYNYSDMTGIGLFATTAPAGVWTTVCDSAAADTVWGSITWVADAGQGTVSVKARAANKDFNLGRKVYEQVTNGESLECKLSGRFLQIRVQLDSGCQTPPEDWPTLQELTVTASDNPPPDQDLDGVPDCADNCPAVYNPDQADCDKNDIADACEIDEDPSLDSNNNCILDVCEYGSCCDPYPWPGDPECRNDWSVAHCMAESGEWFLGATCALDGFECPESQFTCASEGAPPWVAECCDWVCDPDLGDPDCCSVEWDEHCWDLAIFYWGCCPGLVSGDPPSGTVDARHSHPPSDRLLGTREGIGFGDETIKLTLDYCIATTAVFDLCETGVDPHLGANYIVSTQLDQDPNDPPGTWTIVLAHPITAGAVTTIQYLPDGRFVEYTSHPGNADADPSATSADILFIIEMLDGVSEPPHGIYSQDIDHDGELAPADIVRVIDLLNGAGVYASWLDTALPVNTSCPATPRHPCECSGQEGGAMCGFGMGSGNGAGSGEDCTCDLGDDGGSTTEGMEAGGDQAVESLAPAPGEQPDPWSWEQACLDFELRPLGGGEPVTVLSPNTTYEVHYRAGYHAVNSYVLFALSTSVDPSFVDAKPASAGPWANTGNFQWVDLAEDSDGLVSAYGFPDEYYHYDVVLDETVADSEGYICTFTTGSAGELDLDLYMLWIDEPEMFMVVMQAQAAFLVAEQ